MCELDDEETRNFEIAAVGAGLGDGFSHTSKLKVMKLKDSMNRPDSNEWKEEIKNEQKRMVTNGIWEPLDKKDLTEGAKVMTSTWACKKKSNGTYSNRLNARGFMQIAGKHFDSASTAGLVTNNTTIRVVLVLMLLADLTTRIYGVKGAFLKGKFEGRRVFMEVPQGMKHHYWDMAVLRLVKPICGLKYAALLFWQRLLEIMKNIWHEQSVSDPCMYFSMKRNGESVIWLSWFDDNPIIGALHVMKDEGEKIAKEIEIEDVGKLKQFVGCKIGIDKLERSAKFTQPVMIQSFLNKFDAVKKN